MLTWAGCSGGGGILGTEDVDADGDGFNAEADCDDGDASIYPGASEVWDDGVDQDCDGIADVQDATCTAQLTATFPDGSGTTLDGCVDWAFDAAFEYDPDDPPEVTSFTLRLGAADEPDIDCRVELVQPGVCGPGYYKHGTVGSAVMVLLDCAGVDDAYEDSFTATGGYLRIDSIDAGSTPGFFTDEPLVTSLTGTLYLKTRGGVEIAGDLALSRIQIASDSEEQAVCLGVDGDADGDGFIDQSELDGDDCDDDEPAAFPGAAEIEDPSACMRDLDDDGWGATDVVGLVEPGWDCDDTDPTMVPADTDGDGQADVCGWHQLDAGIYHSCVLGSAGKLTCWGYDTQGQVSDAPLGREYTGLGAGGAFSCALDTDGRITCWGDDGEDFDGLPRGPGWGHIGLGGNHGCALDADGTITCWGRESRVANSPEVSGFTQLCGGNDYMCGIDAEGAIQCWGVGSENALARVPAGEFSQVSCGEDFACAITPSGVIDCWGVDDDDQVSTAPGNSGYSTVAAGGRHACALTAVGGIRCWGSNDKNQTSAYYEGTGFVLLTSGRDHSCAVNGDNEVKCWGGYEKGQMEGIP
jgi:hypothetical protein